MNDDHPAAHSAEKGSLEQVSTQFSAKRTGMSFQRTRMSADRTLMSIMRTSLSLIGFGFTIFQFFQKLQQADVIRGGMARHFGTSLLVLGCLMLIGGIVYHAVFMLGLRRQLAELKKDYVVHVEGSFPISLTLLTAVALLLLGLFAVLNIFLNIGPFG